MQTKTNNIMKIYNATIARIVTDGADQEVELVVISRTDFNRAVTAIKDYYDAELASLDDGPDGEGGWLDEVAEYEFNEQTGEFTIICEDLDLRITGQVQETELL